MHPKRVLVCGSNYGTAYIRALSDRPDAYQLTGLLARGSARSRRVAERYNIPLYLSVAEIPEHVHIACAAMGSPAFNVVLDLLGRGIHVLLEHPVRPRELERAMTVAAEHRVRLHVQTLFPSLDAPRDFIAACHAHAANESCALIEVLVTDRSLYASLDILRDAFGPLEPFNCKLSSLREMGLFDGFSGTSRNIPIVIRVQRSRLADDRTLDDGAADYVVDCRIAVSFESGTVTLMSVAGPVVWNARYRKATRGTAWMVLPQAGTPTFGDLFRQQTKSNVQAVDALSAHSAGGSLPAAQEPERLLEVARIWEHLGAQLATSRSNESIVER